MKALRAHWQKLSARYGALTQREKMLVAAALVLGPLFIANTLLLEPQAVRQKSLRTAIAAQQASLADMQIQVVNLQQQLKQDPDAPRRQERAQLQAEEAAVMAQIDAFAASLVQPAQMNALLEGLLDRQRGLRLLSLKTLAPQSVLPAPPKKDAAATDSAAVRAPVFDLYRHGVEVRLEGGFAELQQYLAHLEALPSRLLWGPLDYRVTVYPKAEMTLTVYSLSNDRTWLKL